MERRCGSALQYDSAVQRAAQYDICVHLVLTFTWGGGSMPALTDDFLSHYRDMKGTNDAAKTAGNVTSTAAAVLPKDHVKLRLREKRIQKETLRDLNNDQSLTTVTTLMRCASCVRLYLHF
jgi:hypothetical protein